MPDDVNTAPVLERLRRSIPHRLRATGIHFALSLVIFAVAMALILLSWYPGHHFTVDGGWQGVRIMVFVDLVLGPCLTLIVFNPFKARRLVVLDLSVVAAIQCGALAWGFYAVHSQRPVSVNFSEGAFWSVTRAPLDIEGYPVSMLDALSEQVPALVYVAPPADEDEEARVAMLGLIGGIAAHEDPLRFRALDAHWDSVQSQALRPALWPTGPGFDDDLLDLLDRTGRARDALRLFPFTGRYGECTLAFDAGGALLGALGCRIF